MIHKNILVVDDVPDWRELLQSTLTRSNYHVETAASYEEALEKIEEQPIQLVIVDLRLDPVDENNRDGMRLLSELNKRRINAMVITGYGTKELKEQAQSFEAITFMEKTVVSRSLDKLKTIIRNIFSEMEARDLLRSNDATAFVRGEPVGYSASLAGYPLRESLTKKINLDTLDRSDSGCVGRLLGLFRSSERQAG